MWLLMDYDISKIWSEIVDEIGDRVFYIPPKIIFPFPSQTICNQTLMLI